MTKIIVCNHKTHMSHPYPPSHLLLLSQAAPASHQFQIGKGRRGLQRGEYSLSEGGGGGVAMAGTGVCKK